MTRFIALFLCFFHLVTAGASAEVVHSVLHASIESHVKKAEPAAASVVNAGEAPCWLKTFLATSLTPNLIPSNSVTVACPVEVATAISYSEHVSLVRVSHWHSPRGPPSV